MKSSKYQLDGIFVFSNVLMKFLDPMVLIKFKFNDLKQNTFLFVKPADLSQQTFHFTLRVYLEFIMVYKL